MLKTSFATETGTSFLQVSLLRSENVGGEALKSVYLYLSVNVRFICIHRISLGNPCYLKTLEEHSIVSFVLRDEASLNISSDEKNKTCGFLFGFSELRLNSLVCCLSL